MQHDTNTSNQARSEKQWMTVVAECKALSEADRTISAVVSTPTLDRDREIIKAGAFDASFQSFMKNPVCLINHNYGPMDGGQSPVIGKWLSLNSSKKSLIGKVQFANTYLGWEYWSLYRDGFQRAFSVGYTELEVDHEVIKGERIRVITKAELLEISCVALGANSEALSLLAEKRFKENGQSQGDGQHNTKRFDELVQEHLQTLDERYLNAMQKALIAEPGSMLQLLIEDVVDTAVQRNLLAQGMSDGKSMTPPHPEDTEFPDEPETTNAPDKGEKEMADLHKALKAAIS